MTELIPSYEYWTLNSQEKLCNCPGVTEMGIPITECVCLSPINGNGGIKYSFVIMKIQLTYKSFYTTIHLHGNEMLHVQCYTTS